MLSADELLALATQGTFVVIFIAVAVRAIRRPRRATILVALLFGVLAWAIIEGLLEEALNVPLPPAATALRPALVVLFPFLLFRLMEELAGPRPVARILAAIGLIAAVVTIFLYAPARPGWLTLLVIGYFALLMGYTSAAFIRETRRATGITRRRLQAVSVGSVFLVAAIIAAGVPILAPQLSDLSSAVSRICGLGSALSYVVGFTPPGWLRQVWQAPELREFLNNAVKLPQHAEMQRLLTDLQEGVARTLGAEGAAIGLWDPDTERLIFFLHPLQVAAPDGAALPVGATRLHDRFEAPPESILSGRAFLSQRPLFIEDTVRAHPTVADTYRQSRFLTLLASPITAQEERIGILTAYSSRPSVFAEDDLDILQVLANQCAVVIEASRLLAEASEARAREETARLKEDFLSAVAHDLRTPLTTMLIQVERMQRRAQRGEPPGEPDLQMLVDETKRLAALVNETLDVSRAEEGQLVMQPVPADLVEIARSVLERPRSSRHNYVLDAPETVMGRYDRARIAQLLENLIDNATKYSPDGGKVIVSVHREGGEARLTVSDEGIGVPATELPRLFDRFYRGSNTDHRRFPGVGLGLYLCKVIAEGHGGRIWATSKPGDGTTVHLVLPAEDPRDEKGPSEKDGT